MKDLCCGTSLTVPAAPELLGGRVSGVDFAALDKFLLAPPFASPEFAAGRAGEPEALFCPPLVPD